MNDVWREAVWRQFGAAIDMLENAMNVCPDELWSEPERPPRWAERNVVGFWHLVYHTLFWVDFYLAPDAEQFAPPAPFGLEELDPEGLLPERPYTKQELRAYLEHCRRRCRETIETMSAEEAAKSRRMRWGEVSNAELLLYNLRHVQHHAGQLMLLLRRSGADVPGWVARARE